ncbi:DUF6768 family protein [Croceitalea sp. P059]|uniref:DUF6768 family protein n=1 Tax=Croceitalea sp. P059 TaxID=3075601 RepID=UPI002886E257|nr:DUF6768 family protein [Croceitalea sp. P059]MDT0540223.1 DUF6768 family protein [Croceitalea sp. P059]
MSKDLEKIDELIKEALGKEEAKFYDELEEQNLFGKIGETFRGKTGWLVIFMNVMNLIFLVLFVYCLVQFFNVSETNELIKWTAAGIICWSFMAFIKLYVWMQMDKNDILRELKRLELQVSVLTGKQKDPN